MFRLFIVSVVVCAVVIAIVTLTSANILSAKAPEIDQAYLPGESPPAFWVSNCDNYYNGILSCTRLYHNYHIDIVYDLRRGVISESTWPIHNQAIGDLITVWGNPTGTQYDPDTHVFKVYWASRAAWATTNQFGPDSQVDFITYTQKIELATPWAGFRAVYHAGG